MSYVDALTIGDTNPNLRGGETVATGFAGGADDRRACLYVTD